MIGTCPPPGTIQSAAPGIAWRALLPHFPHDRARLPGEPGRRADQHHGFDALGGFCRSVQQRHAASADPHGPGARQAEMIEQSKYVVA